MRVHVIEIPMKRYYESWGIVTDWLCMMNVKVAMSGEDGSLGPKEYDIVRDDVKQVANFFFTNSHLACLFKMRFG